MTSTLLSSSSSSSFSFPSIYNFPPFYTLQPNPTSRAQQIQQWRSLILEFCRFYRIFSIDASSSSSSYSDQQDIWSTLFQNQRISRKLGSDAVRQILLEMVANHEACWESQMTHPKTTAAGSKAFIYWKTPEQWAQLIYDWVTATGQNTSIMTLFELTQGDLVQDQEFRNLPIPLLKQALHHLSSQGKAQMFAGSEAEDDQGVKFG